MAAITRDTFQEITELLTPLFPDEDSRAAIIYVALYDRDSYVIDQIDFSGSARHFTARLVKTLLDTGDHDSLIAILQAMYNQMGAHQRAEVDRIIQALATTSTDAIMDSNIVSSSERQRRHPLLNLIRITFGVLFGISVAWVLVTEGSSESVTALIMATAAFFITAPALRES
ncbi:MAG: hypothetical protein GYB67_02770 [Chloroflexi bacterium]|nr:hypothetical protein [Chloroflexota bacterium]